MAESPVAGHAASPAPAVGRPAPLIRYGIALLSSAAAFAIGWTFHRPLAEISPFVVFYAAVAFSAWYGGFGPGLLAVAISAVAADYYLLAPRFHFIQHDSAAFGRLLLFVAVGSLIAWLNGQLLLAKTRCELERHVARISEARATRLAESNLIGVFFSDLSGNIHGGNDEFLRLSGHTRAQLADGQVNWRHLTAPEHRHRDAHAVDELQRCRVCTPFEKDHLLHDGQRIPVLMGCAMLDEPGDECIGFVTDLSPQRRAEADADAYQERLSALSVELLDAEQRERRRIATVLHDSVGQTLALARMKLEGAATAGQPAEPCELQEIERLIVGAIQDTRQLTTVLSPPVLYELGLVPALNWLAERTTSHHDLAVDVQADPPDPNLSQQESVVLFEVARELVRNVIRHASATRCTISLQVIPSPNGDGDRPSARIEVRDNGVGFDTSATRYAAGDHGGFGLFNIRERLRRLGGRFEICAQPDGGTAAIVELPTTSPRVDDPGHVAATKRSSM
jgi:PAS domain S-box-containing protein